MSDVDIEEVAVFNKQQEAPVQRLLTDDVKVVNVGLEGFVGDLRECGIEVVHVDWSPPAGGDPKMAALLAKLGT
jgi:FdrA protein